MQDPETFFEEGRETMNTEFGGTLLYTMVIHHHQPVGNFDHVMAEAHEVAYGPFLAALERHPSIPVALHISGPLLEWMERAVPEDIQRLAALVDRGQLEIIGGGLYEPIFPLIPREDRVGQVVAFADRLEARFGARPRGIWLPERVWETALVPDLVEAGVEYTFLDDSLFRSAGLPAKDLHGYFLTEDLGRVLGLFPICERLRYLIPFAEPEVAVDHLRDLCLDGDRRSVLYGDDGEKFGMWPGTRKRVWDDKWLDRFFTALEAEGDWLCPSHPSAVVQTLAPTGKIYLPDGSYREMLEWSLPEAAHARYKVLSKSMEEEGDEESLALVRAGAYRNFRVRYPEANRIYARMLRVSRKVSALEESPEKAAVQEDLYKGQCNCAYWHGVFGGLYAPHLRAALQRHLIRAESRVDQLLGARGIRRDVEDHDLDGRPEVLIASDHHDVVVRPDTGGHLTVWNHRHREYNLIDVITRRREVYHQDVAEAVLDEDIDGEVETIHGRPRTREMGLDRILRYDAGDRACLVDRFLPTAVPAADPADPAFVELGDAWNGSYILAETRRDRPDLISLNRDTTLHLPQDRVSRVRIEKRIRFHETPRLTVDYGLDPAPSGCLFGVELSLGIPTPEGPRYLQPGPKAARVRLDGNHEFLVEEAAYFVDEDLGIRLELRTASGCRLWTYPLYTVSSSEMGFEKTFQGVGVLLGFDLVAGEKDRIRLDLDLTGPE